MVPGLISRVRAAWRLARVVGHVLHGAAIVALHWRWLDAHGREKRIGWWSAQLLHLLGVRVQAQGPFRAGATLLLANHVSWLDIAVVHSQCPRARFVAKAEVRHWPLVGWLSAAVGTLFIERARKRDAMRVVHQMAEALRAGDMVAVFPEGTTGDGHDLLPFHGNLLQAAIATGTPVQAVALRYAEPGCAVSAAAAWFGELTLVHSVWAVACATDLTVHLQTLPPQGCAHAERRALAATMREQIAAALGGGAAGAAEAPVTAARPAVSGATLD